MEKQYYLSQMEGSDEICYSHALDLYEDEGDQMTGDEKEALNNALQWWEDNESFEEKPSYREFIIELFDKYFKSRTDN